MATNSTDYVSLRRLVDYHKNVVLKAIETSGKVNEVGYIYGDSFTSYLEEYTDDNGNKKMRAEIPAANSTTVGLMTPLLYNLANAAVTGAMVDASSPAPVVKNNTMYIPMASYENTSAGLLSNDDYRLFKGIAAVADNDEIINNLYEVIEFLEGHEEGVNLATILNNKADKSSLSAYAVKTGDNAFNGTNTFEGDTVTFKAVTNKPSATFVGPIAFGQALTSINIGYKSNIFAFYSNTKTLNLPFGDATTGDYLTIVKNYGESGTTASTPVKVLSECGPITETTWATMLA